MGIKDLKGRERRDTPGFVVVFLFTLSVDNPAYDPTLIKGVQSLSSC